MWRQAISHAFKLKLTIILICLVACLGAAAVGTRHLLALPETKGVTALPTQVNDVAENDNKVILITLRPEGFEPTALSIPAGGYLFVFNNRTGLDQFALRLDRVNQGTVREARLPRLKREWRQFIQVTPGTYVVTETNHPEWMLQITVTP